MEPESMPVMAKTRLERWKEISQVWSAARDTPGPRFRLILAPRME
jgi:hypothetical protein